MAGFFTLKFVVVVFQIPFFTDSGATFMAVSDPLGDLFPDYREKYTCYRDCCSVVFTGKGKDKKPRSCSKHYHIGPVVQPVPIGDLFRPVRGPFRAAIGGVDFLFY